MNCELIVAFNKKNVIGNNNTIPWYVPEDLLYFKNITKDNIIIMGRKTFDSLPNGPLKNRIHIVITNQTMRNTDQVFYINFEDSFEFVKHLKYITDKKIFIIGGSTIYKQYFEYCNKFHISLIHNDQDGDVSFPFTLNDFENEKFHKTHYESLTSIKNICFERFIFERT